MENACRSKKKLYLCTAFSEIPMHLMLWSVVIKAGWQ